MLHKELSIKVIIPQMRFDTLILMLSLQAPHQKNIPHNYQNCQPKLLNSKPSDIGRLRNQVEPIMEEEQNYWQESIEEYNEPMKYWPEILSSFASAANTFLGKRPQR